MHEECLGRPLDIGIRHWPGDRCICNDRKLEKWVNNYSMDKISGIRGHPKKSEGHHLFPLAMPYRSRYLPHIESNRASEAQGPPLPLDTALDQ